MQDEVLLVGDVQDSRSADQKTMEAREQYKAVIKATSGAFVAGLAFAWTSPALPSIEHDLDLGSEQVSWIVSLVPVGGLVACLPAGKMMDSVGRRGALVRTSLLSAVAWLFMSLNYSAYWLYLGRFLSGLCAGCNLVVIPTYVAEVSHASLRGLLGTLTQLMITAGILLTFIAGAILPWQMLSLACFAASCASCLMAVSLPETPCFLLQRGRDAEAKAVLHLLRGPSYSGFKEELLQMHDSLAGDGKVNGENRADLRDPEFYRPLIVSVGLMLTQQLSCVNNVIFYSSTIFKAAGSRLSDSYQSILVGFAQLLASFVSTYFVEKLGRRVLLQTSNFLVITSLLLLGLFFYWDAEGGKSSTAGYELLPLVSCVAFIVGFSLGLGPVPWLMMGELFPVRFRGPASGIASCVNWASAFLVTKSFPMSTASFGLHGTFWFYAFATSIGSVFVYNCVPETKGKTLSQISAHFVRVTHVA